MKEELKKLRDAVTVVQARGEICISVLEQIVYKQKPSRYDILELKKLLELLRKD